MQAKLCEKYRKKSVFLRKSDNLFRERLGKIACRGNRFAAIVQMSCVAHDLCAEKGFSGDPLFSRKDRDGSGGQIESVEKKNRRNAEQVA